MTIDEAIRITKAFIDCAETEKQLALSEALKLGNEALKTLQKYRKSHWDARYALLPGETKD